MLGGVRLETILQTVKKTDALYQEKNYGNFLAFEPVTLVPFEPHLIDYNLLKYGFCNKSFRKDETLTS